MTMWLSVDPMADKYPSISPYAYCAWNPVKFVDPNGMIVDSSFIPIFVKLLLDPTNKKYNQGFATLYKKLDEDPLTTYRFIESEKYDDGGETMYGGKDGDRDIINIFYSIGHSRRAEEGCLLEESFHAFQFLQGDFGYLLTETGEFQGMLAFDRVDEVEAKIYASQNVRFKTRFERKLLEAAGKSDRINAVWSFLEDNPSVDFSAYINLLPNRISMSDLNVLYHSNGTAYTNSVNIVGRKNIIQ